MDVKWTQLKGLDIIVRSVMIMICVRNAITVDYINTPNSKRSGRMESLHKQLVLPK